MDKKILIVEDEFDVASTMELALDMEGFKVRLCFNGAEALEILSKEELPGLIISDIMMPVMDGYQFTKELRSNPRYDQIPLILCSAAKLDESRVARDSFQDFIKKPFELDDFLEIVGRTLKKN